MTCFVDNSFLVFSVQFSCQFFVIVAAAAAAVFWFSFILIRPLRPSFIFFYSLLFSLAVHFVFAFMFHLLLSPFLLFGTVDARAATVNTLQIFRLNDRRCNVIFFRSTIISLSMCSRFCLPLCCVIAPWLVSSMDAS